MGISILKDIASLEFWKASFAEMLGTFFLVLVGCGSTVKGSLLEVSLCFGLVVAAIIWALGHVSGAHINPIVTIALLVTRKIGLLRAIVYILCQLLGAVLAALSLKTLLPTNGILGAVSLKENVSKFQGCCIEGILGFILVFVVMASCDAGRQDKGGSIHLTIGLTTTLCILLGGPYTGAAMNPSRSLGPAIATKKMENQWIYWIGPIVGAILAALLYDLFFAVNATKDKLIGYWSRDFDDEHFDKRGRKSGTSGDLTILSDQV